ncbi:HIT domain-containing protein [Candidatus Aerophobetes bacterium]|nr:HIT domain-containing protein [Candidatus Aerophobetes bacterium]
MRRLWAPWRLKYIKEHKRENCIFCQKPQEKKDEKNYILLRGKTCFVILNTYPYNNGHVMVAPYRHIGSVEKMSYEEGAEMMGFAGKMTRLIRELMQPDGFNIGMNIGRAAGAGIEDHIHMHIVPRWVGDCNFMPILSDTKVIPEALDESYRKLRDKLL